MNRKNTYRAVRIQDVRLALLLPRLMVGCIVALDVAKTKFVAALATWAGETLSLIAFNHPTETSAFLSVLEELRRNVDTAKVRVVMEPTGTYGDAIRHQLQQRAFAVHLMPAKKTHDARELFDATPSMHDPKAAMVIAKLSAQGLGKEWPKDSDETRRLRALVDERRHDMEDRERSLGRVEALLARHWPEYGLSLDLREQESAAALLLAYPSPARVSADLDGARELLRKASWNQLSKKRVDEILSGAIRSLGVPMLEEEERLLQRMVSRVKQVDAKLKNFEDAALAVAGTNAAFARLAKVFGTYTAAVLTTYVDPLRSESVAHFEKACGLNLRHNSSGEHQGRLSISKRGPGLVRQVLFFVALRWMHQVPLAKAWSSKRRGDSKMAAVVALMRKVVRAVFHVARGADFDPTKLFDARRLMLDPPAATLEAAPTEPLTPAPLTPAAPRRAVARKRGTLQSASL